MRQRYAGSIAIVTFAMCLAASAPVHASPVTRNIGHAHSGGSQTFHTYNLDVNLDGTPDLAFVHYPEFAMGISTGTSMNAVGALNGAAVATAGATERGAKLADAITDGRMIGPALEWGTGIIYDQTTMNGSFPPYGSPLFLQDNVAIGVRLPIAGEPHYGWVEVQFVPAPRGDFSRLLIERVSWETAPNTPIRAPIPEPAALALILFLAPFTLRRRHK